MTDANVPPPPSSPQPYAPPTGVTPTNINPKRGRGRVIWGIVLLVLGAIVLVGGIALGVTGGVNDLSKINDFKRVDVPGERRMVLNEGKLELWAENSSQEALTNTSITAEIIDPATDAPVADAGSFGYKNYNLNGRYGRRIGAVNIPGTREYIVRTDGTAGSTLALGNLDVAGAVFGILGGVFGGLCFGLVFGTIGLVLLIVGLVARSKTKRLLRGQA